MLTELITNQLRWEPLPPNQEVTISFEEVSSAFPDCFLWLLSNEVVKGVEYVSCEPRLVERRCAQPLEVLAQASGHAQHSYKISCIIP